MFVLLDSGLYGNPLPGLSTYKSKVLDEEILVILHIGRKTCNYEIWHFFMDLKLFSCPEIYISGIM